MQQPTNVVKATIASKREVARGTLEVTFELGDGFSYKPGQYVFIELIDPPYEDNRRNRRHFSIVNPPGRKGVLVITTRLRDTGFKKSLAEMPPGTEVRLGPVTGQFVLPDDTARPIVFIAGGIGITPFFCMINHVHDQGLEHSITLLYANTKPENSAYLDDLRRLEDEMPNFRLVLTMDHADDWPGEKRKIDAGFIKDYVEQLNSSLFMVAGPPGMDQAMEKALADAGVDEKNIVTERFTGY